jgi:predicted nucleic acid-binding protein
VRIIVDANIVFSGILKSNSKIGDLLINSKKYFQFISPEFLRYEIKAKYPKIQSISGFNFDQVMEAEYQICKDITFISEEQINVRYLTEAHFLVRDIDEQDLLYVAYSKQFRCKIWSGDKRLMRGLKNKGFNNLITTSELFDLRSKKAR